MSECKYILPCGLCDRSGEKCNQTLNSSFEDINLVSSQDYAVSIATMRNLLSACGYDEVTAKSIKMAISALQRERDRFFPGKWTNKFKKGGDK